MIQELVIEPRNELEHAYIPANRDTARRAIDIASLFLDASAEIDARQSIIALNMNMRYSNQMGKGAQPVTFNGWSPNVMLFVDIFGEPHAAKLVDGAQHEIRYTELNKFTVSQAVELASICTRIIPKPTVVQWEPTSSFTRNSRDWLGFDTARSAAPEQQTRR